MDQIRAIDNKRLVEGPLANLENDFLQRVFKSMYEILGT